MLRRVRNYSRNNERAEQIVQPERSQGVFHSQGLDAWLVVRRPVNSTVRWLARKDNLHRKESRL